MSTLEIFPSVTPLAETESCLTSQPTSNTRDSPGLSMITTSPSKACRLATTLPQWHFAAPWLVAHHQASASSRCVYIYINIFTYTYVYSMSRVLCTYHIYRQYIYNYSIYIYIDITIVHLLQRLVRNFLPNFFSSHFTPPFPLPRCHYRSLESRCLNHKLSCVCP